MSSVESGSKQLHYSGLTSSVTSSYCRSLQNTHKHFSYLMLVYWHLPLTGFLLVYVIHSVQLPSNTNIITQLDRNLCDIFDILSFVWFLNLTAWGLPLLQLACMAWHCSMCVMVDAWVSSPVSANMILSNQHNTFSPVLFQWRNQKQIALWEKTTIRKWSLHRAHHSILGRAQSWQKMH